MSLYQDRNDFGLYSAPDASTLSSRAAELRQRFEQVEAVLGVGPYFAGERFGLVDAVFGPVFRYFDVIDDIEDFGLWTGLPRLRRWREALACRASVMSAVDAGYAQRLLQFVRGRGSELARRARTNAG